jgi:hypothetical protein
MPDCSPAGRTNEAAWAMNRRDAFMVVEEIATR